MQAKQISLIAVILILLHHPVANAQTKQVNPDHNSSVVEIVQQSVDTAVDYLFSQQANIITLTELKENVVESENEDINQTKEKQETDSKETSESESQASADEQEDPEEIVDEQSTEAPPEMVEPAPAPTPADNTAKEETPDNTESTCIHTRNYSYNENGVNIEIRHVEKSHNRIWIATVKLVDPTKLRVAFAHDEYGAPRKPVSKIANSNNAILAINASGFSGNVPFSPVVREGEVYSMDINHTPMGITACGMLMDSGKRGVEQMIEDGAHQVITFRPVLVRNGQMTSTAQNNNTIHPRTAIGQKENGDLIFIVVDGRRNNWSTGINLGDLAQIFIDEGAAWAYNLDGGGSTTLYFNGKVLNKPSDGRERPVPDIIYIAK
ncbi:phosphodiester glycosidase family protein [Dethiobacter alkaliphilus]|uniref:Phosphodiester glycosidase domain-containing protein n=1 Tax=Dethiobacter alkaliphilus AHT 1 TaxID=555088 RepID=C0GEE0_DETAL|nr:phosphodiester glycosidase family protein [Dethiobacter alkaliphilus]EEG78434.1 hypothetical protein DealDRAFT_0849 [Dethiobacter alkaliphilus AHT 1]